MSNFPIRAHDLALQILKFDPIQRYERKVSHRKLLAKIERVRAGLSTFDEEFGPGVDLMDYWQQYWDENPDKPRKYSLPKHWHWMGNENGQQTLGLKYDGSAENERTV